MDIQEVLWSELEKKEKGVCYYVGLCRDYTLDMQDTKRVNRDVKPEGKTDVKAEEIDCKSPRRRAAVEADE